MSCHGADDALLVRGELGFHLLGNGAQPIEVEGPVLVDRQAHRAGLFGAVLAVVCLGKANIRLDLNPGGSGSLATGAPSRGSMQELAALCRLEPDEVEGPCKPAPAGAACCTAPSA